MAELTSQERLQPSLLDRLTDEQPAKSKESRDQRVLSLQRLREGVLRDLAWLLNSCHLEATEDLEDYPLVKSTVLNFGMPDLAGSTASSTDVGAVERLLRRSIIDFEPRILRNTLKVKVVVDDQHMSRNAMTFHIEGELWAQPIPLSLYRKAEVDLETGTFNVSEANK